ncbi:trypsin-like peptidase domain-containing protein [Streptomyces polyrhachis]|uniref:Trypsin-like peptidase domain-containing protein n=1 Tax=Streptomyces polyrhachis TaxID=1282885 RepID=A0ABW2GGI5_9ACTN
MRIVGTAAGYERPGGSFWGSGFFIAPQLVVTCAHVVGKGGSGMGGTGDALEGRTVGVVTAQGRRLAGSVLHALPAARGGEGAWPMPDLALVRVPAAMDADCLWLADRYSGPDDRIRWYGWSVEVDGGPAFLSGGGTLTGSRDMPHVLRTTRGSPVLHGISGGPVLDERTGAVIAVVKGAGREDSSLATPVTGLRALCDEGTEAAAHWHRAVAAHDRHHRARYLGGRGWPRLQRRLAAGQKGGSAPAAGGLDPGERTELYAVFAQLPPPACAGDVLELVRIARREVLRPTYDINDHNPRSWRDGAALLRIPRDSSAEGAQLALEAVAVYAALVHDWVGTWVGTPLLPAGTRPPPALAALREWILRFVPRLDNEVIQERIPAILDGARRPAGAHANVLVEVEAEPGEPGADVYGWRVQLLDAQGRVVSTQISARSVPREWLEEELRAALRLQLSKGDLGVAAARVDFMLPRELFDEPVERWTPHPATGERVPLGRHRVVVLRDAERRASGSYERWRARWAGLAAGPLLPFTPPDPEAESRNGAGAPVPVDSAGITSQEGARRLAALLDGGHPAALCVRHRIDGARGETFHREAHSLVTRAGDGAGLCAQACALRTAAQDGAADHPAAWATDLIVLYDPPHSPPLPAEDLLEPPFPPGHLS